jgi:hypothetical protein
MLTKYAFRVVTTTKNGDHPPLPQVRSFEGLPAAMAYRDAMLKRPRTRKVEVLAVLDEAGPRDTCDPATMGGG